MALAPLFTALGARFALGHRLAPRTWVAIVIAGGGIGGATCRRFGAEGARVAVFDLKLDAAEAVAAPATLRIRT